MTRSSWREFWRRWFGQSRRQLDGDVWRCVGCRRPIATDDGPEVTVVDGSLYCDDSCYREHLMGLM